MTQLTTILDAQTGQLSLDDLLAVLEAEERDDSPPEPISVAIEGVSRAQAGADPDVIMVIEDGAVATEPVEIGTDPHVCEFERQCYAERGIQAWEEKRGKVVQVYKCGWLYSNVGWCARRKQYLGGGAK